MAQDVVFEVITCKWRESSISADGFGSSLMDLMLFLKTEERKY